MGNRASSNLNTSVGGLSSSSSTGNSNGSSSTTSLFKSVPVIPSSLTNVTTTNDYLLYRISQIINTFTLIYTKALAVHIQQAILLEYLQQYGEDIVPLLLHYHAPSTNSHPSSSSSSSLSSSLLSSNGTTHTNPVPTETPYDGGSKDSSVAKAGIKRNRKMMTNASLVTVPSPSSTSSSFSSSSTMVIPTGSSLSSTTLSNQLRLEQPPIASEPLEKGWLMKLGEINKNWKKRYLIVNAANDNFSVQYYDKADNTPPTNSNSTTANTSGNNVRDTKKAKGFIPPAGYMVRNYRNPTTIGINGGLPSSSTLPLSSSSASVATTNVSRASLVTSSDGNVSSTNPLDRGTANFTSAVTVPSHSSSSSSLPSTNIPSLPSMNAVQSLVQQLLNNPLYDIDSIPGNTDYGIVLVPMNRGRRWYLRCENEETRIRWKMVLRYVALKSKGLCQSTRQIIVTDNEETVVYSTDHPNPSNDDDANLRIVNNQFLDDNDNDITAETEEICLRLTLTSIVKSFLEDAYGIPHAFGYTSPIASIASLIPSSSSVSTDSSLSYSSSSPLSSLPALPLSSFNIEYILKSTYEDTYYRLRTLYGLHSYHRLNQNPKEQLQTLIIQICENDILQIIAEHNPNFDIDTLCMPCNRSLLSHAIPSTVYASLTENENTSNQVIALIEKLTVQLTEHSWSTFQSRIDQRFESIVKCGIPVFPSILQTEVHRHQRFYTEYKEGIDTVLTRHMQRISPVIMGALLTPIYKSFRESIKIIWIKLNEIIDRGLHETELRLLYRDIEWQWATLQNTMIQLRIVTRAGKVSTTVNTTTGNLSSSSSSAPLTPDAVSSSSSSLSTVTNASIVKTLSALPCSLSELVTILEPVTLWEIETEVELSLRELLCQTIYTFVLCIERSKGSAVPSVLLSHILYTVIHDAKLRIRAILRNILFAITFPRAKKEIIETVPAIGPALTSTSLLYRTHNGSNNSSSPSPSSTATFFTAAPFPKVPTFNPYETTVFPSVDSNGPKPDHATTSEAPTDTNEGSNPTGPGTTVNSLPPVVSSPSSSGAKLSLAETEILQATCTPDLANQFYTDTEWTYTDVLRRYMDEAIAVHCESTVVQVLNKLDKLAYKLGFAIDS